MNETIIECKEINSKIVIDNFTIYLTKKFNWFNRLMINLIFGLKIEKIKDWRTEGIYEQPK